MQNRGAGSFIPVFHSAFIIHHSALLLQFRSNERRWKNSVWMDTASPARCFGSTFGEPSSAGWVVGIVVGPAGAVVGPTGPTGPTGASNWRASLAASGISLTSFTSLASLASLASRASRVGALAATLGRVSGFCDRALAPGRPG